MVEEIENHIIKRYELLNKVRKDDNGIVFKAKDKKTMEIVVIKKCIDAFHNATDSRRTYREIMILQEINGHENIIRLLNVIKSENDKDIYLVFEYMETDLSTVIKANILDTIHRQFVMYQLLKALKYIHSGEIIHRDLNPNNILINADSYIKVCGFRLARSLTSSSGKDRVMTDYVGTRWYMAPEILLGSGQYGAKADMWSVGCIFGELLGGKPMFPGTSTLSQINKVLEIIGKPNKADIESIHSEIAKTMLETIVVSKTKSLRALYPKATPVELDLLNKLLQFNPNKRINVIQALEHPYVADFHDQYSDTEIACEGPIKFPIDDNIKYTVNEYRTKLYDHILERKKEIRKKLLAMQRNKEKNIEEKK